jgi:hypothetical protein
VPRLETSLPMRSLLTRYMKQCSRKNKKTDTNLIEKEIPQQR